MAKTRTIRGAVGLGGQVYRAGREDELATAAADADIDLTDDRFAGALEGDWGAKADTGDGSDLPEDYPGRKALVAAGLGQADVDALDRDGLIALKGIGEATADEIIATRG